MRGSKACVVHAHTHRVYREKYLMYAPLTRLWYETESHPRQRRLATPDRASARVGNRQLEAPRIVGCLARASLAHVGVRRHGREVGQHEAVPAKDLAVGRVARVGRAAGGGEWRRLVEDGEAICVERRLLGAVGM